MDGPWIRAQEAGGGVLEQPGDTGGGRRGTMHERDPSAGAEAGGGEGALVVGGAPGGKGGQTGQHRRAEDPDPGVGGEVAGEPVGVEGADAVGQLREGHGHGRIGAEDGDGALDDGCVHSGLRVAGSPSCTETDARGMAEHAAPLPHRDGLGAGWHYGRSRTDEETGWDH